MVARKVGCGKIVVAGAFVTQGAVDEDIRRCPSEFIDLPRRIDADQQAAAGAKQLCGHEDRLRGTNRATNHADADIVPHQREHFRMVTSPVRVFFRS